MKYTTTYTIGTIKNEDREWFEKMNDGFKCTGETLEEVFEGRDDDGRLADGGGTTYVVFKGRFTAYGMCRDCGNHYIIARWSRYDRIEKGTFERTLDVEDR